MDYKKRLVDGFAKMAKKYDKVLFFVTFGQIQKWQSELLSLIPPQGVLLDLGTGTGGIPQLAKSKGFKNAIGLDYVFEMIQEGRRKVPSTFLIQSDVLQLPIKDQSVDALTLSLTFRYLTSPAKLFEEAKRVLRKKGKIAMLDVCRVEERRFVVSILGALFKTIIFFMRLFKRRKEYPLKELEKKYTVKEIKEMLNSYGFTVSYIKTYFSGTMAIILAEV